MDYIIGMDIGTTASKGAKKFLVKLVQFRGQAKCIA